MTKLIIVKCWTPSFQALRNRTKRFELRKNDRDYQVGDILRQQEWNPDTEYTGQEDDYEVTWILYEGFGLPPGYCIMSVIPAGKKVIELDGDQQEYLKELIDERIGDCEKTIAEEYHEENKVSARNEKDELWKIMDMLDPQWGVEQG
jgi:hypothetical protein